jgi:hypothetical protein
MAKTIGQLTQATTLAGADEFIIEQSGLTKRVAASVVRGGLVNADIDAAAAIAFSKLAALDSANLLVGNGSNVATKVAVTGDVTISNAGVTAIGSSKVTPTMLTQPLTLATSQATTSGTSIDFTGIPSWVKRVTIILRGVSTSATSEKLIQLGAGSVTTSGYTATSSAVAGSVATMQSTAGFPIYSVLAADSLNGALTFNNVTGNTWVGHGVINGNTSSTLMQAGSIALSGTLDRIRLTTVNGTDTFDAGEVNIMYEG